MVNKLQSNIVHLNQVINSLRNNPKKISDRETQITSLVSRQLKELQSTCKEGFTRLTKELMGDIKVILDDLSQGLDTFFDDQKKVQEIREQILQIQKTLQIAPYKKKEKNIEIGVKIAFFCDIDSPDHNGAVTQGIHDAIQLNIPFITSRSMLRCTGMEEKERHHMLEETIKLEKLLLENHEKWEIYKLGEYVVILPTSLFPNENDPEQKLKALDFDSSLKKIPLNDVLQGPQEKNDLNDFFKLFVENPQNEKLFYLFGHGGQSSVGALDDKHYREFLTFLDKQKCKGLAVVSCSSGGLSSLLNIPVKPQQDLDKKSDSFENQVREHSFITLVQSIGDFPIPSRQNKENMDFFFNQFAMLLKDSGLATIQDLSLAVKKAHLNNENCVNSFKVYLPHASNVPGGFRPLKKKRHFSLTYNKSKQSELLSKKKFYEVAAPHKATEIVIPDKDFGDVHPLITQTKLSFKNKDPILLSMIPGNGHHFIQSIELDAQDPIAFIRTTIDFHRDSSLNMKKGFFIGSISYKDKLKDVTQTFEETILLLAPTGSFFAYRQDQQYYLFDGMVPQKITPLQHAIFFKKVMRLTKGSSAAICSVTGGQESEELFKEAIETSFWPSSANKFREFILSFETLTHGKTPQEKLQTVESLSLSPEEMQTLLFFLLDLREEKLILEILKKYSLNLNIPNFQGSPLICYAIQRKQNEVSQYLISQNVNLNVCDPTNNGSSPLISALQLENRELAKLILSKDPKLEPNKYGSTPLLFALFLKDLEIIEMLKAKGDSLDCVSKDGFTLLCRHIILGDDNLAETLLENGADPNKGNPSPLVYAIQRNNVRIIKKLLDAGAKPFTQDESGLIPFVQAALISPPEIFELFLQRNDCNLTVEDQGGLSPLIATLFSSNTEKITALQRKKVPFPKYLTEKSQEVLTLILNRFIAFGGLEEKLKQWISDFNSPAFESFVCGYLIEKDHQILQNLVKSGIINPNTEDENQNTLFNQICYSIYNKIDFCNSRMPSYSQKLFEQYSDLISVCLEKEANISKRNAKGETPLRWSLQSKVAKFAELLLEKITMISSESLNEVIRSGNLELVTACVEDKELDTQDTYTSITCASQLENDPEGKILQKLVEFGASLNSQENTSYATPFAALVNSVTPDDLTLIDWALSQGAQIIPFNPEEKLTPLQVAAMREDDSEHLIFKKLVELGADINDRGNENAPSPFGSIIATGDLELVVWCITKGAKLDNLKSKMDALNAAYASGNPDILQFIIEWDLKMTHDSLRDFFENCWKDQTYTPKKSGFKIIRKLQSLNLLPQT